MTLLCSFELLKLEILGGGLPVSMMLRLLSTHSWKISTRENLFVTSTSEVPPLRQELCWQKVTPSYFSFAVKEGGKKTLLGEWCAITYPSLQNPLEAWVGQRGISQYNPALFTSYPSTPFLFCLSWKGNVHTYAFPGHSNALWQAKHGPRTPRELHGWWRTESGSP